VSLILTIQIDPHSVLGVAPGASLQEIRDAFRRKAKQHHPDVGGEEWAFRILSQSYEVLSTARVVQATEAEFRGRTPTGEGAGSKAPEEARGGFRAKPSSEGVRPGVRDAASDPWKVVDVENLWVRFEVDHLWLLQDGTREDRFLSCSLNITWPDPELAGRGGPPEPADETLRNLSESFQAVHSQTPVTSARYKVEDNRFQGWLSYAGTQVAAEAFKRLHKELNARGLSVKQWTRDLIVPREWR
jgi:hypothetical protein